MSDTIDTRAVLRCALADVVSDLRRYVATQQSLAADGAPQTPRSWGTALRVETPTRSSARPAVAQRPTAPPATVVPTVVDPPPPPPRTVVPDFAASPPAPRPETRRRVESGPTTLHAFQALATAAAPMNLQDVPQSERPASLEAVRAELGDCERCRLHARRQNIVFGVGSPTARLMFVGEGPGADEDAQGEPFVGRAGQLLTRIIEAMGLGRNDVYIANIVKCRPPQNRDPEPDEVAQCEPFLVRQILVVKPELIVTLGRIAAQALLKDRTPITRLRGQWQDYRGIPVMPTLHPAYLLRTPAAKRHVWDDIQAVMAKMGLERPR